MIPFDFNTATPTEIREEAARRDAKKNGAPDPIQEKRRETLREKEVQAEVIKLYKRHACTVYNYSQPRKAKYLTPGAADLQIFSPEIAPLGDPLNLLANRGRVMWYHEAKRQMGGVYSDDQLKFAALCREAGVTVVGGGVEEARKQLERLGLEAV